MGFIVLLIFHCVLHGFYRFVGILVVCCMGFTVLLIFGCVLHGFYCFVDSWLCAAWVLSVC